MDSTRAFAAVIAFTGLAMPILGMVTGCFRYHKMKDRLNDKFDTERKSAQEAGGVESLYYKHKHKRMTAATFGIPMMLGMFLGMILIGIAFSLL